MKRKIIESLITAILSLLVLSKFNIFDFFTVVPKEYRYEVGLTVYFTLIGIILDAAIEFISHRFFSKISIVVSASNSNSDLSSVPEITFNQMDVAEICVSILIMGTKKQLSSAVIQIPCPAFATMQVNLSNYATIDNSGNCVIEVAKLFGNIDTKTEVNHEMHISFIKEPIDRSTSASIRPKLKDRCLLKTNNYKTNSFVLKARG